MFIRVKYGDDETLVCNPSCAIVNLLASIKKRTGHDAKAITVDLTDETGIVVMKQVLCVMKQVW